MKELPYERLAMQNAVLPHELTDFDVLAYYALCHVYRLYNDKLIKDILYREGKERMERGDADG